MNRVKTCRMMGGVLLLLIGTGCGLGGMQLWRGGADAWPDVVADETTVTRTASGMIVVSISLLTAGIMAISGVSWAGSAAVLAVILFVAGGFWGNNALFGDVRPVHTTANGILAILVLALLWIGNSGHNHD